ncbi:MULTISPECIES: NUDIX hydrolase [Alteribacter]|uniref:CoA pyrophosphatase n=1 Tax=Alteribacter keqinensis TaxID=2483800 RepID=A0A3M7TVJ2_9BACI|nr:MULTISPECIES: CoA pyrophosphatase [Alteribacter]MBM7097175.1 CoA pyrophosphatase [Alteribacter salitolerans]RNA68784.1 CoA pyrophosphatase [Alteribacter keqinensis]
MKPTSTNISAFFRDRKPGLLDQEHYRSFALFVPIIYKNDEPHLLFQVRGKNIKQPGEICFPGGKVDPDDKSAEDAAVRELVEEIGVTYEDVVVYGPLDYMITPYRFNIFPFIGEIHPQAEMNINRTEVEEVFTVPVQALKDMEVKTYNIYLEVQPEETFPYHLIPGGENYNWRTGVVHEHFYEYEGRIIWGLTARILKHVLHFLP